MPLLLRLLFCCGMRIDETTKINAGDIDFERNLFILKVTKKYKQRLVPFDEKLAEIIYLYCTAMGILNDSEAYLFPSNNKYNPISANSVGNYYRIIRRKAGIVNIQQNRNARGACLHCFRHTFTTIFAQFQHLERCSPNFFTRYFGIYYKRRAENLLIITQSSSFVAFLT